MRLTAVAFLIAIAALPSTEAGADGRPISAEIVRGGRIADEGHPGDVRVTLANGHREMWTLHGNCELPRVAKSGLVGWTHGTAFHSKGALMNHTLVVAREDKVLARIKTFYPFIDVWDFADGDLCLVVLSAGAHGPGRIEKFRIANGYLLGGCYEGHVDEWPDWARQFIQKAQKEGTYVE